MEKHLQWNRVSVTNDGTYSALVVNGHLEVYDVMKSKLVYKIKGTSDVDTKVLKFSPSKEEIAWLQTSPEELFIVHLNEEQTSRISSHPDLPFHDVLWSPDGGCLAAISGLSMFIDIYSVGKGETKHIASVSGAKEDEFGSSLAEFSPDGEYFATVSVSTQGYSITIYNSGDSTWDCIQRIVCNDSHEVGGLLWCVDSASLLVWQAGATLQLRLWTMDGTVERSLATDDAAVCCVSLSDCGRVAAILTTDSKVRILDLLTWRLDLTDILVHHPIIHVSAARCRLKESKVSSSQVSNCEPIKGMLYELNQCEGWPRKYRTLAQFSVDGQYLATYYSAYPSTLWVWRLVDDSLLDTVVVLRDNTQIKELLWHKEKAVLGVNLSNGRVLVWKPEKCVVYNSMDGSRPFTAQQCLAALKTNEIY